MENKKSNKKIFIIIGFILVVIIAVIIGVNIMNKNKNNNNNDLKNNTNLELNTVNQTEDLEEYTDESYGISFKYAKTLKETISGGSKLNLEHPKIAGSKFFYNSPDTPQISYNKDLEIQQYIQQRITYGNVKPIKQEETTISKIKPIDCTLLEYEIGAFTQYIYLIPHRAGMICLGITFPTGEPIQEFTDIIDSIVSQ